MGKDRASWKDVYFAFKAPNWQEQLKALGPSQAVVRACMKQMEERGEDYTALDAWSRERFGKGLHNRATAKQPSIGERRVYKAAGRQHTRKPFFKLPLDTLVEREGERVVASFEDGRIVITRCAEGG